MINNAEASGAPINIGRCGMGEWDSRKGCANTHSRPKATPVRFTEPEGALALMMPEQAPLWSTHNPVSLLSAAA